MSKYAITNGELYNGKAIEMKVCNGAELKVQGSGSGVYKVVGKLTANATPQPLALINCNNFAVTNSVFDEGIYVVDVSGLYSVSVEDVSGFTKIYGTILSD